MTRGKSLSGPSGWIVPSPPERVNELARGTLTWRTAMRVQDLFDLTGRTAVVTGGSRGLGLEIAHGLGEAGARVVVTARRQEWLGPAEEELRAAGIEVAALSCDVAEPEQVEALAQATVERFGR